MKELETIYNTTSNKIPKLEVHEFDPSTFRTEKPDWFLEINPNGKVKKLFH
jgi:hypothetical protein